MNFQTHIPLERQKHNLISYDSKVVLLGSCFSENIGEKFNYFKFQNLVNPFGILFHPLAIENFITNVINEKQYSEDDIFYNNEAWHCFDAHSRLSNTSKELLLEELNSNITTTHQCIKNTTHVVITLGTAWVYRYISTDSIVANCHKIPQKQFLKELLSVDAITQSLEVIISLIRTINPDITFLFTVSPVRHLKDGFVENTQSKSHLISAIHDVVNIKNKQFYFPSYELVMDELRDYRFFKEDMIHPNAVAIDYIWEKFTSVWFADNNFAIMESVDSIQKSIAHKPFNATSEAHTAFKKQLEEKISKLESEIPSIRFSSK
ncbi:MAG: GSCFA domain-containing protein [Winogradskyella sp.]|uniref:GSCFA domain-containing protein n=1 Tax=Winogradskyella sp. TaxID=1883156 RepID=UPI000F3E3558|nr:GSCFA domain-containing protein [Winogradskyella sp.]RNC85045.1 MAG: GSCFA domain-containing protein [Winogradskyella sp.]